MGRASVNGNGGARSLYSLDFVLRPVTTALLALVIVGVAAWQVLVNGIQSGPFVNWAGIIVGVYFGAHVASMGAERRRALDVEPTGVSPRKHEPPPPPPGD